MVTPDSEPLPRPEPGTRGRDPEAGYNLVILAVMITVTSIALAAALPVWSHAMKREKEEELIFRGLQYAEAIRVFQNRFGRLPVRLEELVKTEPRSIRRLWRDPITESRDWGLVVSGGPGSGVSVDGGAPGDGGRNRRGGLPETDVGSPGAPKLPQGPIRGVFSRSTESSVKVFLDRQQYNQWKFTVDLLAGQQGGAGAPGGTPGRPPQGRKPGQGQGRPLRLDARWIGRPFRPGIKPGTGGSGLPPSDRPPGGNRDRSP